MIDKNVLFKIMMWNILILIFKCIQLIKFTTILGNYLPFLDPF